MDSSQRLAMIDITTGELDDIYDGATAYSSLDGSTAESQAFWDEESLAFYLTPDTIAVSNTRVRKISLGLGSASGISLADAVSVISEVAGQEIIEDYDVSELTPYSLPGYLLSEQRTARDYIQPLSDIYFFDGIESDYKLRYRTIGRSSSASITEDDMVELDNEGKLFARTRVQEAELPRSVQITTADPDNAYQLATQQSARNGFPNPSNRSNNQDTVEVPNLCLDQDFSRQAAEKRLYTAWNERNGYEFKTHWGFLRLDPSDVATATFDDGLVTDVRLQEANSGADFSLEIRGVGQGSGQYVSDISGQSGSSIQVTVPKIVNSQLFLLDVPLLQDTDAPTTGISRMYWAGNSNNTEAWSGGTLFESENLVDYDLRDAVASPVAWGVLVSDLSAPSSFWTWDDDNTVPVAVQSGEDQFSSVSEASVLSGANALAIIRDNAAREVEIIQFATAEFDSDTNILTLSRLLRGRRGTEVFGYDDHLAGQKVVLLQTSKVSSFLDQSSEADQAHLYRLVTLGQSFSAASDLSYTPSLRALRPYALVNHTAVLDGVDIDLAATRRTRYGGELMDGTGTVPLNEESEAYELEIWNAAGDTLLRTVTGLSTPEYTYLEADIITDFGTTPASLNLKWYQISAAVGRGFSVLTNVEVM